MLYVYAGACNYAVCPKFLMQYQFLNQAPILVRLTKLIVFCQPSSSLAQVSHVMIINSDIRNIKSHKCHIETRYAKMCITVQIVNSMEMTQTIFFIQRIRDAALEQIGTNPDVTVQELTGFSVTTFPNTLFTV